MNTPPCYDRVSALVTRLALVLALAVGFAPVLAYWTFSYVRIITQLEDELAIRSITLADFITVQPETWDVATDRLVAELNRHGSHGAILRVYNPDGLVVAQTGLQREGPFITRGQTIYDFGTPVGRLEVEISWRRELLIGLAIFAVSLAAAWLAWVPLRTLPLAALAAAERKLKARDRYQRALLDNFPFLVWLKDMDSRYLAVNAKYLEIAGYGSDDDLIGKTAPTARPSQLADSFVREDRAVLVSGQAKQVEEWVDLDGQRRCFSIYKSPVSLDGEVIGTVGCAQDVTENKHLEDQLLYRALHDPLTGLANRSLFLDRIGQANEHAARNPGSSFAVVFVDLDRFKLINDSLGHEAGDLLLREVALRLIACTRKVDTVSRYGGDEFTLVLDDVSARQTVHTIKRIREGLKEPIALGVHTIQVEASYGIAYGPQPDCQPEDLLRNANIALHVAKTIGKNRISVYRRVMHEDAIQAMRLRSDMHRGLEAGEFFMVYQPIFKLDTMDLAGFEALVRWRHPVRGIVSPAEFIPQAEESGFILELGNFVLDRACADMAQLLPELSGLSGLSDRPDRPDRDRLTLSVNISPRQFSWNGLADRIDQALRSAGLPPSALVIEITESSIMDHPEGSARILARLKDKGVAIALDDFGTGYSSMSALQKLPLDRLKVDMSFVRRMAESTEDREIVRAIITLAQSLQLTTVAEGVETEEQRQALGDMHCVLGQGYLYSKPLALADVRRTYCRDVASQEAVRAARAARFGKA